MVSSNHRLIISFPASSLLMLPIFDKNIITSEWLGLYQQLFRCFIVIPQTFLLYFIKAKAFFAAGSIAGLSWFKVDAVQYTFLQIFRWFKNVSGLTFLLNFDRRLCHPALQCTSTKCIIGSYVQSFICVCAQPPAFQKNALNIDCNNSSKVRSNLIKILVQIPHLCKPHIELVHLFGNKLAIHQSAGRFTERFSSIIITNSLRITLE